MDTNSDFGSNTNDVTENSQSATNEETFLGNNDDDPANDTAVPSANRSPQDVSEEGDSTDNDDSSPASEDESVSGTQDSESEDEIEDQDPTLLETLYQARGISLDATLLEVWRNISLVWKIGSLYELIQPGHHILLMFMLLFFVEVIPDIDKTICFVAFWIFHSAVDNVNIWLIAEVKKQSKRSLKILTGIGAYLLFVYVILVGGFLKDQELYLGMIFVCPNVNIRNGWTLLWLIAIMSYIAKVFTILFKILILALPQQIGPSFQTRGKYYFMIEAIFQFYRKLLPITPWLYFLASNFSSDKPIIGGIHIVLRIALYARYKLPDLFEFSKAFIVLLKALLKEKHYGTRPTFEELANSDPDCSICKKNLTDATRLSCSHIFCSECIHKWFMSRQQTCPNCRTVIIFYSPDFRNGETSSGIHIF